MTDAGQRAGIYTRMSLAVMNDQTKVADQEHICRELAGRLDWEVARVYQDNNRSAWRKDRHRPAWDAMLADIEAGKISAVVVYHGDRLIRQPDDLGVLLKLADGKGVKLASPTGTRDLGNPDDRFVLYIEAAMAMRESDNTSRRRKAQYARWRRAGRVRPGGRGGRAFGFTTDGITQIPGEAQAIREAAARLLAGEPAGAIARDMTAAGWRTPTGGEFGHTTLRKMLARPRLAGLMPDGENKAAWEPVLDRDTWEAVCAALDAKAQGFGYATNARKWLGSGIYRCGACGSPLQIRGEGYRAHTDGKQCVRRACELEHHWEPAPRLTGYGCVRKGCRKVQRSAVLLDSFVTGAVVAELGKPGNPASRPPAHAATAGEFGALAQERARVEELLADHTKGRADLLMQRLDSIDHRLALLRGQVQDSTGARLLAAHAGITADEFRALPLATQRALVGACFTVTVLPASRRGPGFRTEDVQLTPRGHT